MQGWKFSTLCYFFLFLSFTSTFGAQEPSKDLNKTSELLFFVISHGSFDKIDTSAIENLVSDANPLSSYYKQALYANIAYKNGNIVRFDTLINAMKASLPQHLEYDSLGYYHYLKYRQYYNQGEHQKAMEQLIYAKETFKRNGQSLMALESISKYYGNYANSIFSTYPVEDLSKIEHDINEGAYQLQETDTLGFWAKMILYDKLGVLLGLDGQLDRSEYYLKYVIDHTKDKSNVRIYHNAIGNLSINQFKNKHFEESIKNATLDLKSSLESGNRFSSAGLGLLFAKNYLGLHQPDMAMKYLIMADSFSVQLNGIFGVDILETRAQYFKAIGNTIRSNEYFQQYLAHKDSINLNAIHEMEFRMQIEQDFYQKIRNYEAQRLKNQAIISMQKRKNILVIIAFFALLPFTLIIGFMLQKIRKNNKLLNSKQKEILDVNEELLSQKEELKAQNETITNLNYTLEQKVQERTHDLEEKTKIIEAFLYQMSHRFRTPIANLKGLVNLISHDHSSASVPEYLDLSNDSINKLDSLLAHIKQLLEFDQRELVLEEYPLKESVEDVLSELNVKYRNGKINTENNLNMSGMPKISSVRDYDKVMLREILDNAYKFSLMNHTPHVILSEKYHPEYYHLIIEDNGPGIVEEHWKHVFEPFYVANESSKGDGLGFYIASIAANKTGCKIQLDKSSEKGTRMIIIIPTNNNIKTNTSVL